MKAIWTGWSKSECGEHWEHRRANMMRTNVYKVPAHRRTLIVNYYSINVDLSYESVTERFFLSLPCLYFVILSQQTPAYLYVFTGSPDWRSPADPLYQFPWPNRVGSGSICLGQKPCRSAAKTIQLFFESPFTTDLPQVLKFKLGKKQHQASSFKHWHALTKQYPTIGENLCYQDWRLQSEDLNPCDAPKFSFGQTVKLARSKFIGKVRQIYSDESETYYIVKPYPQDIRPRGGKRTSDPERHLHEKDLREIPK